MPDYPQFHATVVGLSPSLMKHLHPSDLKALVECFKQHTGVDVLNPIARSAAEVWRDVAPR